jgi:type II secretory pathway pseudopilin PulG
VTLTILGLAATLVIGAILPATRNAVRRGEKLSAEREARSTLEGLLALDFSDLAAGTLGPAPITGYPDAERTVVITPRSARVWTIEVQVRVGDEEAYFTCLKGRREP